tara:strand:- start:2595 stop:2699 length:105 start_codon:yes stop_codon:yes gene_type:complete
VIKESTWKMWAVLMGLLVYVVAAEIILAIIWPEH